jgi:hypothetical protein
MRIMSARSFRWLFATGALGNRETFGVATDVLAVIVESSENDSKGESDEK